MSWKKHFTPVKTGNNTEGSYSPFTARNGGGGQAGPARSNYSSYLPDVYIGSPNRVERYGQYNTMDMDSEVNAALDILAEFTSQTNQQNKTPFILDFKTKATNSEITIIQQYLKQWCKLQNFETRIFRIMRNIFKFGDQFFIRDPETKKLFHVDPAKVTKIIVNESQGKTPEQYIVKDFNLNFADMVATTPYQTNGNVTGGGDGYLQGGVRGMVGNVTTSAGGNRFQTGENEISVDAEHIVLVNLSPLKQKISELRADELNLDINLTASNGEKKYVQVHRNLFEKSNYQTTNEGGLKAEPTYDYIELVKYISWVVRKPNTNYNERILQANLLGQYGSIEVTTPSPTQPSINVTTTPPSTQYPPIGRKGVEDEEEVLFNGELYWWIESLQQWRLQER